MLIALLTTAFAQEEVCDAIYTADELRSAVQEANGLIDKGEVSRALSVLGKTRDVVYCMDTLVNTPDLAAMAHSYALANFFSQELEESVRWGRLVNAIEPDHDWGDVGPDHPLTEAIAEAGEVPSFKTDKGFAIEKNGSVFVDGRFASKPEAAAGMHHLVQRFNGKGHLLDGFWQDGDSFPEAWLGAPTLLVTPKYYNVKNNVITPKGKPPSDIPTRDPIPPMVIAGAGLVGVSAVLYTLAGFSHGRLTCDPAKRDNCPTTAEELTKARSRGNLLVLGAGVTFAAGVGVGVTGILTDEAPGLRINGRF